MIRAFALALVAASTLAAEDADPVEVLMRLRDQVMAHAGRIPNHTCVETIRRDRYQPEAGLAQQSCDKLLARHLQPGYSSSLKMMSTDRLRLDVAFNGEREMYSWAGASRFEDGELDELIREGPIGTGPFVSMLASIFTERGRFTFEGDKRVDGRSLMEYSFRVPEEQSHYRVKVQVRNSWVITGYTGTLLLDARKAELVQATVRTAELRPETTLCETDTTLEYGEVKLGGVSYLLPKLARQRFIGRNGHESENTIHFSACREFLAASTLTFGAGKGKPGTAPDAAGATPLPAGLAVVVELTAPIDGGRAAAGDRIEGRLVKAIATAQERTLVAEGAVVEGRLMRVENRHSPSEQTTIALRWESVDIDGTKTPLTLTPDRRASGVRAGGIGGLRRRGEEFELPAPGEGRYAIFHFLGRDVQVPAGQRSEWLTTVP